MIKVEDWVTIRNLYNQGYGKKRIAKILGISVNTVRRALKSDQPPEYKRSKSRDQKILPYAEVVKEMYLEKKLIGTRIYEELKKLGYDGSLMTLYRYLKKIKQEPGDRATIRFETLPGVQAQFDWSPFEVDIAGEKTNVYCFLVVLGYSRMKYMSFSAKQNLFSVIEAIEEALHFFGGSPQEIVIDNPKQMVSEIRGGARRFNETFLAFAGVYRFKPVPCRPHHPQTKGKVERPFFYIAEHFIKGNSFDSLEDLINKGHAFVQQWNAKEHRTTLKKPIELFEEEKGLLHPLPETPFLQSLRQSRKVSWDCLVSVGGSRYSVPAQYAGSRVWFLIRHGYLLEIQDQSGQVIAVHELSKKKGSTNIKQEHYKELQRIPRTAPRIKEVFIQTFSSGKQFYELLQQKNKYHAAYHARKILDLRTYYPDEAIEQALQKATKFKAASFKTIANILKSLNPLVFTPPETEARTIVCAEQAITRPLAYYNKLLHSGSGGCLK